MPRVDTKVKGKSKRDANLSLESSYLPFNQEAKIIRFTIKMKWFSKENQNWIKIYLES